MPSPTLTRYRIEFAYNAPDGRVRTETVVETGLSIKKAIAKIRRRYGNIAVKKWETLG